MITFRQILNANEDTLYDLNGNDMVSKHKENTRAH